VPAVGPRRQRRLLIQRHLSDECHDVASHPGMIAREPPGSDS
jgi:hypothetical protein